ncbi:MAG: DUF2232 domain-containing protein [Clostridia bacterium]|nr:DUF2232 domain-containing protein [Clostridia bacterium]
MDNQKVTVFRQKNKWGLTAASIVACLLLSPAVSLGVFLPQVLSAVPIVLLALLGYAGPVSAAVCSGIFVSLISLLFGLWGGVCAALLVVPTVLVSAVMLEREQPFWHSVAAGGVTMFASMGVVVALLSMLAGSDVVSALAQIMKEAFAFSGTFGDALLSVFMQTGLIAAPQGVDVSGVLTLDPQVKTELLDTLLIMMDSVLRLELPMQMATGSVAAGLLGQAVLRKGLIHRGTKVEYPRLKSWRVPNGWGRILGGTLLVLYVLAMLVPRSMNTMFYVFNGVFDQIFALQGVAALCYMLDERGKSITWQWLVFAAGYFFLNSMAVVVGIFDQSMDFAHRREKLNEQENPFDPRRGA